MSLIGLITLICGLSTAALTTGRTLWQQGLIAIFLVLSATAFLISSLQRPSLVWEVIDDFRNSKRKMNRR